MNDTNKIILIGRAVRDPEMRYTPNGTAVTSFTLANNSSYGSGDNKKESVSYFDCVAWSKAAEIITEYLKKGKQILITGRLNQRSWKDSDGNNKSKIEIVVEEFQFIGGRDENKTEHKPENAKPEPKAETGQGKSVHDEPGSNPFDDDDMPF